MKYISVKDASKKWQITERTVRNYCVNGKIQGSYIKGNNWFIPENAQQPTKNARNTTDNGIVRELVDFIDQSPVSYFAVKNVEDMLINKGYKKIEEYEVASIKVGDKVFFVRNGSALIAFNIGKVINESSYSFHIIASHSDSPSFKVKPKGDNQTDCYNKINVEPYGGMICSTWLDRPLSLAGKVFVRENDKLVTKLLYINEDTLIIPNLCIHFNRTINSGYTYNMANDMQPFFATGLEGKPLNDMLARKLNVKVEDIVSYDLYLVNRDQGVIWGQENEFVSAPRLDDLECVFTSSKAFVNSENDHAINVLYISDNEEVGSSSAQGADGDFLEVCVDRIISSLKYEKSSISIAKAKSFIVSADNAHAVHPNNPGITDSANKCYMNGGIAIKSNASQTYTSDGISSAIFQEICTKANAPYQFFSNRSDVRGGSTLGNILLTHFSLLSVDIGLPQLAMHSAFETAGAKDVKYAVDVFSKFYQSNIVIEANSYKVE